MRYEKMTTLINDPFDKSKQYKDDDLILFTYKMHIVLSYRHYEDYPQLQTDSSIQHTILSNFISISSLINIIVGYAPANVLTYKSFKKSSIVSNYFTDANMYYYDFKIERIIDSTHYSFIPLILLR